VNHERIKSESRVNQEQIKSESRANKERIKSEERANQGNLFNQANQTNQGSYSDCSYHLAHVVMLDIANMGCCVNKE
jgi:hypothetical protein